MPPRAPSVCASPGCPRLAVGGLSRCPVHAKEASVDAKARDRLRGNPESRGYGAAWGSARKDFLSLTPKCCRCQATATIVDHITPHKGDRGLFWDKNNWQPMCKRCHDRKTASEDRGYRK
ncbi:McrA Restriction endonuclease [uncultured Caudovirales phage]|uniref:McrA Restriction endonuclease n=1 Tax=uncultured Caudovirales phage TaxID=2100421 RepID=A0A6J5RH90_9CAUD|nr:McrA Restriction endonuclease [uncultured Caudovirales phage]